MKKSTMLALVLMIMMAALAIAARPAKAQGCGITTQAFGFRCEYRPGGYYDSPMVVRDGVCQNNDVLVLQLWLTPGCWNETGFVTATASNPDENYDITWLARPRFVAFNKMNVKYVEVRLKGIYLWSTPSTPPTDGGKGSAGTATGPTGEGDFYKMVQVQVTPVSAQGANIIEDTVVSVPWQPTVIMPPPPCTPESCPGKG